MRYRTTVTLAEDPPKGKVDVDLGRVVATAEVHINGRAKGGQSFMSLWLTHSV